MDRITRAQVLDFPCKDGSFWSPEPQLLAAWGAAYPGIDIGTELLLARAWLYSNPGRLKTRRGMARFCNGWLARNYAVPPAGQPDLDPAELAELFRNKAEVDAVKYADEGLRKVQAGSREGDRAAAVDAVAALKAMRRRP